MKYYCPKCYQRGRLENHQGKRYRINHDERKNGKTIRKRCYIGNLETALERIQDMMYFNMDTSTNFEDLHKEIVRHLKKYEQSQDDRYDILISELLELSAFFGRGWSKERHYLVKQGDCPHCKKSISVRFTRIGRDPNTSKGRYDIKEFWLEKGKTTHTGRFSSERIFASFKGKEGDPETFTF